MPGRLLWASALVVAAVVVIRHHRDYLRGRRPLTFGAFLQTAGWSVLLLTAAGGLAGAMEEPATRAVTVAAAVVGALLVGAGGLQR